MLRGVDASVLAIGERNARFVIDFLATEGIPVLAQRLGGDHPLQVSFHVHAGLARVRQLGSEAAESVRSEELRFRQKPGGTVPTTPGDVTLF